MGGSSPQSKGGLARAAKLSPERRREIATRATEAKWSSLREASHLLKRPGMVRLCVSLRLPGPLVDRLVAFSREDGLSLSRIATRAIVELLVRREAGEDAE